MKREEKRRKFHEAVLNTLYPPPPSQPKDKDKPLNFDVELINPDDYGKSSSSTSDDEGENEYDPKKLTRAQRKRLRKKKLKQHSARRGHIIGPLLPPTSYYADDKYQSPDVRQNAAEGIEVTSDKPGESSSDYTNQNKLKQRRMAKKLAKEKFKFSSTENCDQHQSLKSSNELDEFDQDQNLESKNKLENSDCLPGS